MAEEKNTEQTKEEAAQAAEEEETKAEEVKKQQTSAEQKEDQKDHPADAQPDLKAEEPQEEEPQEEAADADLAADPGEASSEETDGANDAQKSSFFKKKKDKRDEQLEELSDKLRRQMAEFENFRKRTDKEKTQRFDMGARSVIEKILPIVDNFERGLSTVDESQKDDAFISGMDKIYRQLLKELTDLGVTPIETEGRAFDPKLHNAVMQVQSEELESGMIAQELQKGYMYKDTVVRHSMVSVVE